MKNGALVTTGSAVARLILQNCISDVANWCSSRRVQLNASKTEVIWSGSRHTLKQVNDKDLSLYNWTLVPFIRSRDLGVMIDSELK